MILYRFIYGVVARAFIVTALACTVCCSRPPTLEERIKIAATSVNQWNADFKIPKGYEQELVALAKEPTGALDQAFRALDEERAPTYPESESEGFWRHLTDRFRAKKTNNGQPHNDGVWLTGTLITILAFDTPPVSSRDNMDLSRLKSRLVGVEDLRKLPQSPRTNEMLAKWPWSDDGGSWHLLPMEADFNGSSDGAIAPPFEYYLSCFKRRHP